MDHIRDTHFQDVKNSMFGRPREFQCNECRLVQTTTYSLDYRTSAIITRDLYIFYPIFHCGLYCRAVSVADNLCTKQGNSSIFVSKIHGL